MLTLTKANIIIDEATRWAARRPDILALGLAGSWACGAGRPDSDVDFVLLTPEPELFRRSTDWMAEMNWGRLPAAMGGWRDEDYGALWSRHLSLTGGTDIEFGFSHPSWASTDPIDHGTFRVVSNGFKILADPYGILAQLVAAVQAKSKHLT